MEDCQTVVQITFELEKRAGPSGPQIESQPTWEQLTEGVT